MLSESMVERLRSMSLCETVMIPLKQEWELTGLKGGKQRSISYKSAEMGRSLGH